ncbi:hypothetical protein [Zavarzinia compransoris]|uniref:Uncharacterized protein n=1 Tax=Zavarzinia compransoris TaxID=1264899 RepID=A0A317E1T8_9PROT|nr:hypothetical protein [Zavarzinia compransoris]PWR20601.1 hypothetical protein DKG75_11375 [Zavarzinia compransoris]TDP43752.1 hypothetical protein DES42_1097 [Zavarzinia compransoris]
MDTVDNLVLEHLRHIRRTVDVIRDDVQEQAHRMTRLESMIGGLRRDQALDAENAAHIAARLDTVIERVNRIEGRLNLREE